MHGVEPGGETGHQLARASRRGACEHPPVRPPSAQARVHTRYSAPSLRRIAVSRGNLRRRCSSSFGYRKRSHHRRSPSGLIAPLTSNYVKLRACWPLHGQTSQSAAACGRPDHRGRPHRGAADPGLRGAPPCWRGHLHRVHRVRGQPGHQQAHGQNSSCAGHPAAPPPAAGPHPRPQRPARQRLSPLVPGLNQAPDPYRSPRSLPQIVPLSEFGACGKTVQHGLQRSGAKGAKVPRAWALLPGRGEQLTTPKFCERRTSSGGTARMPEMPEGAPARAGAPSILSWIT